MFYFLHKNSISVYEIIIIKYSKTKKHTCESTVCSVWTREMLIVSSSFWTEIPWGAKVTKCLTNGVCHVGSQGTVVT